jgi:hypothetical protein
MELVSLEQFKKAVSRLDGSELRTLKRGSAFRIRMATEGLLIAPASSGVERLVTWPSIAVVLERFNRERSLSPSRYQDLSFNKSYILALLKATNLA